MRPLIGNSKFIFTIPEPRPAYASPVMAIKSYLISIFNTHRLLLCFCTECSLPWEQLSSLLGQREFAFTLARWSCSVTSDSATPWTVVHQAPQSMKFSRQEYRIGLPFPSPYTDKKAVQITSWWQAFIEELLSRVNCHRVYWSFCLWDLSFCYYKTVNRKYSPGIRLSTKNHKGMWQSEFFLKSLRTIWQSIKILNLSLPFESPVLL